MYYSYIEIEYVATSFSPARMDLAVKLLKEQYSASSSSGRTNWFNEQMCLPYKLKNGKE